MFHFTANELSTVMLVQLILSSVGFSLDLMYLDKRLPYIFMLSFPLNALLVFTYQSFK